MAAALVLVVAVAGARWYRAGIDAGGARQSGPSTRPAAPHSLRSRSAAPGSETVFDLRPGLRLTSDGEWRSAADPQLLQVLTSYEGHHMFAVPCSLRGVGLEGDAQVQDWGLLLSSGAVMRSRDRLPSHGGPRDPMVGQFDFVVVVGDTAVLLLDQFEVADIVDSERATRWLSIPGYAPIEAQLTVDQAQLTVDAAQRVRCTVAGIVTQPRLVSGRTGGRIPRPTASDGTPLRPTRVWGCGTNAWVDDEGQFILYVREDVDCELRVLSIDTNDAGIMSEVFVLEAGSEDIDGLVLPPLSKRANSRAAPPPCDDGFPPDCGVTEAGAFECTCPEP